MSFFNIFEEKTGFHNWQKTVNVNKSDEILPLGFCCLKWYERARSRVRWSPCSVSSLNFYLLYWLLQLSCQEYVAGCEARWDLCQVQLKKQTGSHSSICLAGQSSYWKLSRTLPVVVPMVPWNFNCVVLMFHYYISFHDTHNHVYNVWKVCIIRVT